MNETIVVHIDKNLLYCVKISNTVEIVLISMATTHFFMCKTRERLCTKLTLADILEDSARITLGTLNMKC